MSVTKNMSIAATNHITNGVPVANARWMSWNRRWSAIFSLNCIHGSRPTFSRSRCPQWGRVEVVAKLIDLTSEVHGWLRVTGRAPQTSARLSFWYCQCRCEKVITLRSDTWRLKNPGACPACRMAYKLESIFPRVRMTTIDRRGEETSRFTK